MNSTASARKDDRQRNFTSMVNSILTIENDTTRMLALDNLHMAVQGLPEEQLLISLTDPEQAKAVIHIKEPKTENHAATAVNVGKFLQLISKTVNEVAKTQLRAQRRSPQLLVTAFTPGSLAVTIEAPTDITDSRDMLENVQDAESVESTALKKVSMVLTTASDKDGDDNNSTLDAQLSALSPKARKTLNSLVNTVKKSDWTLSGTIVQKNMEPMQLSFTQHGVTRIIEAMEANPEKPEEEELHGYLDGYKRSEGILFINQDAGGTKGSYKIAVSDVDLIQQVAIYATHSEQRYVIKTDVYKTLDKLGDVKRTSRLLKSIKHENVYTQGTL